MINAIEARDLRKTYPGFELSPLSFDLPKGTILGLVGENGAGKSTVINLLTNAVSRDGGNAKVLGCDPVRREFDRVKQDIGVVLDEAHFPSIMNAEQVSRMMRSCYIHWDAQEYEGYLRRFDLPKQKPFRDYSRGMRMKLAIAVALSHDAKLLILDEPTGGLDPMAREELLDILNEYTRSEEHSILISSHITSDLEKICDNIAFIHQGHLMFCEEKDRLMEDYALLRLSREEFESIPSQAVVGMRENAYNVEALVRRGQVNRAFPSEHTTLEEIILFFAKGVEKK